MTYDDIKMAFQRIPWDELKNHSLFLNEIFKKLSAIDCRTKHDKTLSFEVPDNC
jgi:hypothetical protein